MKNEMHDKTCACRAKTTGWVHQNVGGHDNRLQKNWTDEGTPTPQLVFSRRVPLLLPHSEHVFFPTDNRWVVMEWGSFTEAPCCIFRFLCAYFKNQCDYITFLFLSDHCTAKSNINFWATKGFSLLWQHRFFVHFYSINSEIIKKLRKTEAHWGRESVFLLTCISP